MLTNNSLTVFQNTGAGYTKFTISKVFAVHNEISSIIKSGPSSEISATVFIPKNEYQVALKKQKDLIIIGPCELTIDNTSDTTISSSLKALKETYQVFTVVGLDPKLYGPEDMQHYQLALKG